MREHAGPVLRFAHGNLFFLLDGSVCVCVCVCGLYLKLALVSERGIPGHLLSRDQGKK